jgi:myo-inositol-1(or 4)-monophosphatase
MPPHEPTLQEIETIARHAGKILLSRFGMDHQVRYKGEIDPVTEADHLSEAYILNEIRIKFPDHRVVSEEDGSNQRLSPSCWYVDPLDGTVNYAHGIPIFCVSIAYTLNGVITLAVVYDPCRDEMFSAEKGKGAWMSGDPIRVSACDRLIKSLLVTGFPYDIATTGQTNLENYVNLAKITQGVRRLGSAALDCCSVACGRLDGYWELSVESWDVAAGALIVTEAGGMVSQADGSEFNPAVSRSILCANSGLHQAILKVIHDDPFGYSQGEQ